jgi:hypothetical protein
VTLPSRPDASPPSSGAEGLIKFDLRDGFRIGRIEGGRLVGVHPAARYGLRRLAVITTPTLAPGESKTASWDLVAQTTDGSAATPGE